MKLTKDPSMCNSCSDSTWQPKADQRRRLWDLNGGWHCSIIGTCLTLSDLRSLARKLPLKTRPDFPLDYQLHGFFVQEAASRNKASKLLNKLLDKRHSTAIRRVRELKTEGELEDFWTAAQDAGDIPGPYWAVLSHPAAGAKLSERMFADVHMLSHLVGASNRADMRRLKTMQEEIAALREKLFQRQNHHHERLLEHERMVAQLREDLSLAERAAAETLTTEPPRQSDDKNSVASKLRFEIARLRTAVTEREATLREQQERIDQLGQLVQNVRQENALLEESLLHDKLPHDTPCPFDLGGRCLLYVGGRQQAVPRLRSLVETWNGRFMHHDGGVEKSIGELAGAVVRADAVVFPTDCVSHEAALRVKRLCRQTMKPFVPLRTSGVASFVAGLKEGLDGVALATASD